MGPVFTQITNVEVPRVLVRLNFALLAGEFCLLKFLFLFEFIYSFFPIYFPNYCPHQIYLLQILTTQNWSKNEIQKLMVRSLIGILKFYRILRSIKDYCTRSLSRCFISQIECALIEGSVQ